MIKQVLPVIHVIYLGFQIHLIIEMSEGAESVNGVGEMERKDHMYAHVYILLNSI